MDEIREGCEPRVVYEPPLLIELSEEDLPGLEFTNGSTQSMTATMTNCGQWVEYAGQNTMNI